VQRWIKAKRLEPSGYQGSVPLFDPAYIDELAAKLNAEKSDAEKQAVA
jgi:hypothetical protein